MPPQCLGLTDAHISITIYSSDVNRGGRSRVTVPPDERSTFACNDLTDHRADSSRYGLCECCLIESDVPNRSCNITRLDSRLADMALLSTIAFFD